MAEATNKSIKYKITCRGTTDILVQLADPENPLPIEGDINKDFVEALDYFCQRFYPSANSKRLPWRIHQEKDELKGGDGKNKQDYENWVAEQKSRVWPLGWYWKPLLPLTDKWNNKKREKWRVCISQIRQWVMVSVYEKIDDETINLLRPPLFGRSDHLLRPDPYWALATQDNQSEIAKEWAEIKKKYKDKDALYHQGSDIERWYVIGRHDLEYTIVNVSFIKNGVEIELKVELHLQPFVKTIKEEGLPDVRISQPYDLVEAPIYKNRQEKNKKDKSASILLASDHMCRALEKTSEVWNDKTARSVLFVGLPGSGKEILSKSLYQFREIYGKYIASSLVPGASEYNQKLLCCNAEPDKDRSDPSLKELKKWKNKEKPFKDYNEEDGFFLKSRAGMLFLDEIDKAKKEDRAMLLRFLENKEFAYYEGTEIKRLDQSCPLIVFAGSMPRAEMFKLKPGDFWTRISHVIDLKRPFDIDDEYERLRAYCAYFIMFWHKHVPNFFVTSELDFISERGNKNKFLINYYQNIYRVLMDDDVIRSFADIFAHECCSENDTLDVGPRHIRPIVSRTVFSIVELIVYDKRALPPLHEASDKYINLKGERWPNLLKWLLGSETAVEAIAKDKLVKDKLLELRWKTHIEIVSMIAEAIRKVCI